MIVCRQNKFALLVVGGVALAWFVYVFSPTDLSQDSWGDDIFPTFENNTAGKVVLEAVKNSNFLQEDSTETEKSDTREISAFSNNLFADTSDLSDRRAAPEKSFQRSPEPSLRLTEFIEELDVSLEDFLKNKEVESFDPDFKRFYFIDPQKYLETISPQRVELYAKKSPFATPIKARKKKFDPLIQGEKLFLQVFANPGMPVTFTVPSGMGEFKNGLTTTTLPADRFGTVTATYTTNKTTIGNVVIIAGSPVHTGQVSFQVNVLRLEN